MSSENSQQLDHPEQKAGESVSWLEKVWNFLTPPAVNTYLKVIAWLSLFVQTAIIGTGGAVRLTGSGMGCPTWPTCTGSDWFATPELGIHGLIEASNRTMSGPILITAVLAVLAVYRFRQQRKDLWIPAVLVLSLSILQGLIGGITVWTEVNPWSVGTHYLISAGLVGIATFFLLSSYASGEARIKNLPKWLVILSHITTLFLAITVVLGVLTTGSGPHSGAHFETERNGLEWELLTHLHSYPAYALMFSSILLIIGAFFYRKNKFFLVSAIALFVLVVIQMIVGIIQANSGLPILLVGIHMVLAAISVSVAVLLVYFVKSPASKLTAEKQ